MEKPLTEKIKTGEPISWDKTEATAYMTTEELRMIVGTDVLQGCGCRITNRGRKWEVEFGRNSHWLIDNIYIIILYACINISLLVNYIHLSTLQLSYSF